MPRTRQVTLHLDLDATDTIRGLATVGDGRPLPFDGWLELSAVLDEARRLRRDDGLPAGDAEHGR